MLQKIGVIGGGMIGASLAALFAGNGIQVTLVELDGFVDKAQANCQSVYSDLVAHDLVTAQQAEIALSYIHYTTDYSELSDMEVLIESVLERTPVKHAAYAEIEKHCTKLRAIASTTSAISADELAAGFQNPQLRSALVVAHPWNPPHLAPCIEIVKSQCVSEEAVSLIQTLLSGLGKKVVVMNKNIPGFIGNRLQYAMLREAIHMVEEGAATPEMIDETLKYSFAPRYTAIGLFEHFDNCGQDLTSDICDYLFPDLCDAKQSQKLLVENVKQGKLGIKSGQGMLDWRNRDIQAFRSLAASPYYRFFDWKLPEKKAE